MRGTTGKIPILSLFSGIGGLDLGLANAGFNPVLALEKSSHAVATYNLNFGSSIAEEADICEWDAETIIRTIDKQKRPRPRGIVGGPPCQAFSLSNVHATDRDPRAQLPFTFSRIVREMNERLRIDFFLFENVTGMRTHRHAHVLERLRTELQQSGFYVFESVLNALDFGVPQSRKRLFLIGLNRLLYKENDFKFPIGRHDRRVVNDCLRNLPEPVYFKRGLRAEEIPYHPNHWTMRPISSKFGRSLQSDMSARSFRLLHWDKPSGTVAYGNRELHIHPNKHRRVSLFEAMLLQGLPRNFRLLGNLSDQVTLVSDAIPPALGLALGKQIKKSLESRAK